jgi:hypothetical protein
MTESASLRLAVQVGFSGTRHLFEGRAGSAAEEAAVRSQLLEALHELRDRLRLTDQHFVVGVSQLAAGADTLFTEALAELGWLQRIFLPQTRSDFLAAIGTEGPDFRADERERTARLLASPHVIEESVVSFADDRAARFEDTNLRILDEADVLVCLLREGVPPQASGPAQLMQRAQSRGVPVLVLVLTSEGGALRMKGEWQHLERFRRPALPERLHFKTASQDAAALPGSTAYAQALKSAYSQRAGRSRGRFQIAAAIIVGTHVVATLMAVLAMQGHASKWEEIVIVVLAFELALLAFGFMTHRDLHHKKTNREWALARLCAEVGRSVTALEGLPVTLHHLQAMPFPSELRAVLQTITVLHRRESRGAAAGEWSAMRDRYLKTRLTGHDSGQLPYYLKQRAHASSNLKLANRCFTVLSALAFLATATELLLVKQGVHGGWASFPGLCAAWFPVVAVGAMSFASALDLQAREHEFSEMHRFLKIQAAHIAAVSSLRELAALAGATEARLLGETLHWFARRAYTSVA